MSWVNFGSISCKDDWNDAEVCQKSHKNETYGLNNHTSRHYEPSKRQWSCVEFGRIRWSRRSITCPETNQSIANAELNIRILSRLSFKSKYKNALSYGGAVEIGVQISYTQLYSLSKLINKT